MVCWLTELYSKMPEAYWLKTNTTLKENFIFFLRKLPKNFPNLINTTLQFFSSKHIKFVKCQNLLWFK